MSADINFAVLSVRGAGGGFLPAIGVWGAGYGVRTKVDIKSFHPKVKASKSAKRFQRYRQMKFLECLYLKILELLGALPPGARIK